MYLYSSGSLNALVCDIGLRKAPPLNNTSIESCGFAFYGRQLIACRPKTPFIKTYIYIRCEIENDRRGQTNHIPEYTHY